MLRCAFCHDAEATWACERCDTRLHADCRTFVSVCPTLGCRPRLVVSPRGASLAHLVAWLLALALVWLLLSYVPGLRFFEKRKLHTLEPAPRTLIAIAERATSPLGRGVFGAIVIGSLLGYTCARRSPWTRRALMSATTSAIISIPLGLFACLLALSNMARV